MAAMDVSRNKSGCHELLVKLKRTTECLLSAHTAQGVWGTYGGLRRVCLDTEAILFHGLKHPQVGSSSCESSFWQFVQGLKWLSPSLAPVIDRLNKFSQLRRVGNSDVARAWLRESVRDHTLMCQLEMLVGNEEHLSTFYHEFALLRHPEYVAAIRICFKAIELGKPALLSEINPYLLKSGPGGTSLSRSTSLPISQIGCLTSSPGQSPSSSCLPAVTDMGNNHSFLKVTYSHQLSSSNQSLTVDPSLGASSLLHQKTLSEAYFTPASDSPRVQESFGPDLVVEAARNDQHYHSRLNGLQQSNLSYLGHLSQSQPLVSVTGSQSNDSAQALGSSVSPQYNEATNRPSKTLFALMGDNVVEYPNSDSEARHSSDSEGRLGLDSGYNSYSLYSLNSTATPHSHFDGLSSRTNSLDTAIGLYSQTEEFPDLELRENDAAEVRNRSFSLKLESDIVARNKREDSHFSSSDSFSELQSSLNRTRVELQVYQARQVPGSYHTLIPFLNKRGEELNTSENSNQGFLSLDSQNLMQSSSDQEALLSSSSRNQIVINIVPGTPQADTYVSSSVRDRNIFNPAHAHNSLDEDKLKTTLVSVKSDPSICHPLLSSTESRTSSNPQYYSGENSSPGACSSSKPWIDAELYNQDSLATSDFSPATSSFTAEANIRLPSHQTQAVTTLPQFATASVTTAASHLSRGAGKPQTSPHPPSASRRLGHKRWVSDTSTITVEQFPQAGGLKPASSTENNNVHNGTERTATSQARRRASEFESSSYHGTLTKPAEGQSLMSYLTSQDFNTCANLEKENVHFRICEALIEAFESTKFNRLIKRQQTGSSQSSSDSSSHEEIQELRQRIRIRKREKMMAKGRLFPSLSDEQNTDTATNSRTTSSPTSSHNGFSSLSDESETDEDEADGQSIDMTMSSDGLTNLTAIKQRGLNLSMASLYSDAEFQKNNQQIEKNTSLEDSTNPVSAESIAISLLRKFSEKHLPKASELKWLVSECDAPQRLLPLPTSMPVSPDDADIADMPINRTRLRGNLEWAPPRAQIIFSIHPSEKREDIMIRQNFRCAGCGNRVDPAFMKRYRYCEYLGKYFCQCCHTGETSIIPGRVLERWDFHRYAIANFSHSLLEKMWREPLFHIDTINPSLYKRIRSLESIRESRQQLVHLHSLLVICKRDPVLAKEMQKLPSHWVSNDDAYSMDDFTQVRTGQMLNYIKSFVSLAISHVTDCQLCQGLGFICGLCQDQRIIFPFQLESVTKCPVCQACYHKDCFVPGKCPKCIRLEARRRIQQQPLSPDSPDSGESNDSILQSSSPTPQVGSADDCR